MTPRRVWSLLGLSVLFVVVGLVLGRSRDVGASGVMEEEGPTEATRALLAVFDGDAGEVGEAVARLLADLSAGDTPLLDRQPQYDWVDAYRVEPLRAADLVALDGTEGAPGVVLGGLGDEGLDGRLARARGVFSAVTVGCGFDALSAELALQDGRQSEEHEFAGVPLLRTVLRRSRVLEVDLGGASAQVMVRLTAQLEPAVGDALRIEQQWELELLVARDAASTARLVASWTEVASEEYGPENRLWSGWVLHGAFEDAAAWTAACAGVDVAGPGPDGGLDEAADEPGPGEVKRDPTVDDEPDEAERKREDAGGGQGLAVVRPTERTVRLAPLCEGARLVRIEPHARRMQETSLELKTISDNLGMLDAEIAAQTPDLDEQGRSIKNAESLELGKRLRRQGVDEPLAKWRAAGVQRWAGVLGASSLSGEERAMLGRLVDRFGDAPDGYERPVRQRLRARWQSGALAEFLSTDDVRIPVCPDDIAFAADKLGWGTEQARRAHAGDLDLVVGSLLLESGSVRAASERQWEILREVFGFGQAMMDLFSAPANDIEAINSDL